MIDNIVITIAEYDGQKSGPVLLGLKIVSVAQHAMVV